MELNLRHAMQNTRKAIALTLAVVGGGAVLSTLGGCGGGGSAGTSGPGNPDPDDPKSVFSQDVNTALKANSYVIAQGETLLNITPTLPLQTEDKIDASKPGIFFHQPPSFPNARSVVEVSKDGENTKIQSVTLVLGDKYLDGIKGVQFTWNSKGQDISGEGPIDKDSKMYKFGNTWGSKSNLPFLNASVPVETFSQKVTTALKTNNYPSATTLLNITTTQPVQTGDNLDTSKQGLGFYQPPKYPDVRSLVKISPAGANNNVQVITFNLGGRSLDGIKGLEYTVDAKGRDISGIRPLSGEMLVWAKKWALDGNASFENASVVNEPSFSQKLSTALQGNDKAAIDKLLGVNLTLPVQTGTTINANQAGSGIHAPSSAPDVRAYYEVKDLPNGSKEISVVKFNLDGAFVAGPVGGFSYRENSEKLGAGLRPLSGALETKASGWATELKTSLSNYQISPNVTAIDNAIQTGDVRNIVGALKNIAPSAAWADSFKVGSPTDAVEGAVTGKLTHVRLVAGNSPTVQILEIAGNAGEKIAGDRDNGASPSFIKIASIVNGQIEYDANGIKPQALRWSTTGGVTGTEVKAISDLVPALKNATRPPAPIAFLSAARNWAVVHRTANGASILAPAA